MLSDRLILTSFRGSALGVFHQTIGVKKPAIDSGFFMSDKAKQASLSQQGLLKKHFDFYNGLYCSIPFHR